MNEELEGIVLRQSEYRDQDGLLWVFFSDIGKNTLAVKGMLKETNRNRALCMPYACCRFQFDYQPNRSIFTLKTGSVLASHYKIRENLAALNAAALLAEATEAVLQPGEALAELYHELKFCLGALHAGKDAKLIVIYYLSRLLREMGLEPNVDECVLCAKQEVSAISIQEGGFVCPQCAAQCETLNTDLMALKLFRWVNKAEQKDFAVLEKTFRPRLSDVKIFVDFLTLHSGLKLESWRFFSECTS